jgi:hypothetical protein
MTMARHKAHVPWWHLRRRLRETLEDLHQLEAQHRKLSRQWSEDRRELDRMRATYEPEIVSVGAGRAPVPVEELPAMTTWGARNVADWHRQRTMQEVAEEVAAWDPDATTMIPVIAVAVDPAATGPSGITVIRNDPDGAVHVIKEIEERGE